MKKILNTIAVLLSLTTPGCAMDKNNLINEVSSLQNPEKLKPTNINYIVEKYIKKYTPKDDVLKILREQNLNSTELKQKNKFDNCQDCDETYISAGHKFNARNPIIPTSKSLVIEIGFKNNKVEIVRGWYVAHAY